MTQYLKGDLLNHAYQELRISGLTAQPRPEEIEIALRKLESMANEFLQRNICIGYNFEDTPDANSSANVPARFREAFELCLAVRLMSTFGKGAQPDPLLLQRKAGAFTMLSGATALRTPVRPPSTMPIGGGNRRFGNNFRRYYPPILDAPNSCDTRKMYKGDTNDFREHFDAYLVDNETIDSYTIEVESGLTLESDSLETPDVLYRVTATGGNNSTKVFSQVKIIATSSIARVTTRLINFEITGN